MRVASRTFVTPAGQAQFSPIKFQFLFALYVNGEMQDEKLFEIIYGWRADGGPDYGTDLLKIMQWQIHTKLKKIGLQIYVTRQHYLALGDACPS